MQCLLNTQPWYAIIIGKRSIHCWNNVLDPWFYGAEIGRITDYSVGSSEIMATHLTVEQRIVYTKDRLDTKGRLRTESKYFFSYSGIRKILDLSSKTIRHNDYVRLIEEVDQLRYNAIHDYTDAWIRRRKH